MGASLCGLTRSRLISILSFVVVGLGMLMPPAAGAPVADPGNVIIVILDDVSIDELPIYDGYPLLPRATPSALAP